MKPRICAVATGKTFRENRALIKYAEKAKADLIEIRIDYLEDSCNFATVKQLTHLPLIATNRPVSEGGCFRWTEKERVDMLLASAEAGFDFVDIELSAENVRKVVEKIKAANSKPIVSFHDFNSTPTIKGFFELLRKEANVGADVCKIVTTARSLRDSLTCLSFVAEASKERKTVVFCMGDLGKVSRLLSPVFGGYYTYASIRRGRESAPGQLTVGEMRTVYGLMGFIR